MWACRICVPRITVDAMKRGACNRRHATNLPTLLPTSPLCLCVRPTPTERGSRERIEKGCSTRNRCIQRCVRTQIPGRKHAYLLCCRVRAVSWGKLPLRRHPHHRSSLSHPLLASSGASSQYGASVYVHRPASLPLLVALKVPPGCCAGGLLQAKL